MGTTLQVIFAAFLFLVLLVAWGAFMGRSCTETEECPAGYLCTGNQCTPAPTSFRPWRAGPSPRKGWPPCPPGLIARGGLRNVAGECVHAPDLLFGPPGGDPRA